ncbi:hypothetical protein ACVIJW_003679 [Bradyrhizobium barranii subsp. barranii]
MARNNNIDALSYGIDLQGESYGGIWVMTV